MLRTYMLYVSPHAAVAAVLNIVLSVVVNIVLNLICQFDLVRLWLSYHYM